MPRSLVQRSLVPASVLVLALAVAACGSSGSGSSTPAPVTSAPSVPPAESMSAAPAPAGDEGAVQIADFAFAPGSITVAAGSTVTWTNGDSAGHTVTADDGAFDSGTIANGATFTQAFPDAGSFAYHCTIHPAMTATVVVE
jgi:plastocyanin